MYTCRYSLLFKRMSIIVTALFFQWHINAATKTWNNTAGGSWATGGNWSPAGVPAANDDIIIPAFSGSTTAITNVPNITLNSLTFTGTGFSWLQASASGNVVTLTTSWTVPANTTITIGATGARLVWTLANTCTGTLNGYVAFDAGTTNRNFTVNGTLIVNSTGMLYDPNPSGGSDFYLTSGATLRTQKTEGITTTASTSTANINYNVAVCFGGSYSYATGANYMFNAASNQTTGAGLNQNTPANVTVALTGTNILTMTGNTTMSGILNLTSGLVNLNGLTLTLGTAAATPGTLSRTAGHLFNGTFSRWFTTTALAIANIAGLFPMGTSVNDYRPFWVGYSANLTTAGRISVNHTGTYPAGIIAASHSDASWGFSDVGVSDSYWTVTVNTLVFNGATGIVRYGGNGFGSPPSSQINASLLSSVVGTHANATSVNVDPEVNRTGLTTANIANAWRIGTKNLSSAPLPVKLMEFSGKYQEKQVYLNWKTATEENNSHFVVERTMDGFTFLPVASVAGHGNSSELHNYSALDKQPEKGINYYRLVQIDLDGSSENSHLIAVNCKGREVEFTVYPSPANDQIFVEAADMENVSRITISDIMGVKVFEADGFVPSIDASHLSSGVYQIILHSGAQQRSQKIIVQ
jgi:hypothetical protein